MDKKSNWIWLDKNTYPKEQKSFQTLFSKEKTAFRIAEFTKKYKFTKKAVKAEIEVSGDTKFWLYLNNEFVGLGPVCHGGDYGGCSMPYHYYNYYTAELNTYTLEFYSMVQLIPTVQCDLSWGHGGFILFCKVTFEDGSVEYIKTDDTWQGRINRQRYAVNKTDMTLMSDEWCNAVTVKSDRVMKRAPIKMLAEEEIIPNNFSPVTVMPGEMKEIDFETDKIYSCYFRVLIKEQASYTIILRGYEKDYKYSSTEMITGNDSLDFRGLEMVSLGGFKAYILNTGKNTLTVDKISLLFNHYPCEERGDFQCSDKLLNKIYDMGKWAVKICKQTIELDSPLHQENLGCTGDYMISSLMNYVTYGDADVTRLDIVRTAHRLEVGKGKMFHTTYSMLWVQMLYDYYMFTGDESIFKETEKALDILMERFNGYVGINGLIDNPPDYMFVDWLIVDGISMHHPPKALGQGVLSAFYYGGLLNAAKIAEITGKTEKQKLYKERSEKLKKAFNEKLYDEGKELYFDGLNDKYEPNDWLPENVEKRYFSWHTNTLAVLYGICEGKKAAKIMEQILNDMSLINPQPYFMHFVLDAIYKSGLFEKYGMKQIERWKAMTEFDKGLQEGWYDCSGYGFDYSHVWGGTPTYQLPVRLSGLEIKKAGFKEITLNPSLCGLEYAYITIPTPYGNITVNMKKGEEPEIKTPSEIKIVKNSASYA